MNKLWKRLAIPCTVAATVLLGMVATPAEATAPPKNSGWIYLPDGAGAAYFDADLAGYPGWEKITVCDNKSNDRGVQVTGYGDNYGTAFVQDPSNNGHCTAIQGNLFPDGYGVDLYVEEYSGDISWDNRAKGHGIA
jgi:hypothetical protein